MWSSVIISDGEAAVGSVSGVTILPAGPPQALAELIETLVDSTGAPVLLVHAHRAYESWLRTAVTLAAGRWPDLKLAWRAGDHAPLATLSALSAAKLQDAEPALAVRLVDRLLEHSWSGAWVASVARLGRPAPSLAQHARSLLPGSSFLVRHHPQPAVLAPTVTDPVPPDDLQASGQERVLLVQDGGLPPPVVQRLQQSGRVAAVRTVGVPGSWRGIYGGDAGQLALVPQDAAALLERASWTCAGCGLGQADRACPFCHQLPAQTLAGVGPDPQAAR